MTNPGTVYNQISLHQAILEEAKVSRRFFACLVIAAFGFDFAFVMLVWGFFSLNDIKGMHLADEWRTWSRFLPCKTFQLAFYSLAFL